MKNVLIIAGLSERYYFDPFVRPSQRHGLRIHLFDPARVPDSARLSVRLNSESILSGRLDTLVAENNGEWVESSLPLNEIDIGWYLREGPTQRAAEEESIEERFRRNESRAAIKSLLSVLPCNWINRWDTMDLIASNKLYQQVIAQRAGLMTPETVISNDPECISGFSQKKEGLLLKTLGYIRLDDEGRYFLYSQRVSHDEIASSGTSIRACPIFAQEYIEKKYEYRVMAIGDCVLACRIDSQASELTKIDWRHYDLDHVAHDRIELPHPIQQRLLYFMKLIGLKYGAIDLIETPLGDFVFLEINPSGQWSWIADLAGLEIPTAVAQMLSDAYRNEGPRR